MPSSRHSAYTSYDHLTHGRQDMSEGDGRSLSNRAVEECWVGWTPAEVTKRLHAVAAPWCMTAGWALDLFVGEVPREHSDSEIAVPAARFDEIMRALPGYEWDVGGDGRI